MKDGQGFSSKLLPVLLMNMQIKAFEDTQ